MDRALKALSPYLGDIVLCGAWAWYLYRRLLAPPGWMPAELTRDLDCIGRERLPVRGAPLSDRLEASGFECVPRGSGVPAASYFAWPDRRKPDIEIEFLVPARGAGTRRVVALQGALMAPALRHLEILLDAPLNLSIDDRSALGDELEFRGTVRVPRMGHFVIQKALIHGRREREDQVKDLFYVFDLVDSANGVADTVAQDVHDAEIGWQRGVAQLLDLLTRRAAEPAFLKLVAQQFPEEGRPTVAYMEHEIRDWVHGVKSRLGSLR